MMEDLEKRMDKTLAVFEEELNGIRAGRANPAILNKVMVDYYGSPTPIAQIATVSSPEPRSLTIQPWDLSILSEIEKAIQKSDIGINPNNDGKLIRLSFPPLTEERRKELVKTAHKKTEDSKIAIRSIRRDAVEHTKKQQKAGEITEDDLKDDEKEIQDITDKKIKQIDAMLAKKETEILEV